MQYLHLILVYETSSCNLSVYGFSLAHQPLAGKEGLDGLCYSNCANAKILDQSDLLIAIDIIYHVETNWILLPQLL